MGKYLRKILYPGTFDPIHNGHIDIASRAAELFDELEFVVAVNPEKDTLFSLRKRVKLIKESVSGKENIKVNYMHHLHLEIMMKETCPLEILLRLFLVTTQEMKK